MEIVSDRSLNTPDSARAEVVAATKAMIPLIIGAAPFGVIFGTLAAASGLSFMGALAMSAFVFAGSAQFIAVGLIAAGTPWLIIVATTFVVNLRHMLYSASLLPYVKHLSQWWLIPLAFFLTDEAFVVVIARYEQSDRSINKHWYYLGAAVAMYINWQIWTFVGLTVGQLFPNIAAWGLDFAMPVTFIGMIIPYLISWPMVSAVVVAGLVSMLAYELPHQLGLMVATIAGIVTGLFLELTGSKKGVKAP
ncbi:MAG: AzlC family ABC transporter permease [Chloroflexota bacterium]